MRNRNRLIRDFRKQTKTTIWKHMEAMAVNYAVYSNRLKGFAPFMNDDARFIGNQLERIYIQHASRCVKQQSSGKSELLSLTPEDIVSIEVPRQKTKIGF